jgi:hypothetical protein
MLGCSDVAARKRAMNGRRRLYAALIKEVPVVIADRPVLVGLTPPVRTTTYRAVKRGDLLSRRLGRRILIAVPALRAPVGTPAPHPGHRAPAWPLPFAGLARRGS